MWRRPGFRTQATKEGALFVLRQSYSLSKTKVVSESYFSEASMAYQSKQIDSSFFPRDEGIFSCVIWLGKRGVPRSTHKDKRRGDLGKGMNRDLLARPYVSPNLASTRRQILSRWTELKSTKAKRIQKQKTENEKAENLKLLARSTCSGPRRL